MLEIIIVSDAVEGTFVDLGGESHCEQVEAKHSRRGGEILNEGEEIKSPKRKVTPVESQETQDYEYKEEEEWIFVSLCFAVTTGAAKRPSAVGSWLLW